MIAVAIAGGEVSSGFELRRKRDHPGITIPRPISTQGKIPPRRDRRRRNFFHQTVQGLAVNRAGRLLALTLLKRRNGGYGLRPVYTAADAKNAWHSGAVSDQQVLNGAHGFSVRISRRQRSRRGVGPERIDPSNSGRHHIDCAYSITAGEWRIRQLFPQIGIVAANPVFPRGHE